MESKQTFGIVIALVAVVLAVFITGGIYFSRSRSSGSGSPAPAFTATSTPLYTLSDIANHATEKDCWTAVNGGVYDITSFIPSHPGGKAIVAACGKDGSPLFNGERAHTRVDAQATLDTYRIGTLQ